MRPSQIILPLVVVAVVGAIAVHQQATLSGLKEQARGLEESLAHPPAGAPSSTAPASATPVLSPEQRAALLPEAKAAFFGIVCSPDGVGPDQEHRFVLATRSMDVASLVALMAALKADPALPEGEREDFEIHFAYLITRQDPEKAMAILIGLPKVDGSKLCTPLGQWSAMDPAAAAAWFQEQLRKGNPVTDDPELRREAIQALFRSDPDRGLQLASSLLPADASATREINKLAAETVASLADEREHASYLAALRRVAEKSPGNPVLAQIRAAYLNELPAQLKVWTVDDVTTLLDDELSPAEKLVTARNLATFTDLDTPERWADWFGKIGGELDEQHPLRRYLRSWSLADYAAVGQWLDHYPEGAAKNQLALEYADLIRDLSPEEAARHAEALPASPEREEVLKAIHNSWQAKAPDAAERFARENGLEP